MAPSCCRPEPWEKGRAYSVTLQNRRRVHQVVARLVVGKERAGKLTALNQVRRQASGEVLVMTDVRQTLAPQSFRALVSTLGGERVGCVSGNLVLEGATGALGRVDVADLPVDIHCRGHVDPDAPSARREAVALRPGSDPQGRGLQ